MPHMEILSQPSLSRLVTSDSCLSYDSQLEFNDDEELHIAPPAGKVWERAELQTHLQAQMNELVELLGASSEDVLLLLRHCRWDADQLTETFYDNPEGLRKQAGVTEGDVHVKGALCGICFCDPPIPVLPCGHGYCKDCWIQYVSLAVSEGKGCLDLRCPEPKCSERLRHRSIKTFCAKPEQERYARFWLDAIVEEGKSFKWCPGVGCGRACIKPENTADAILCSCGNEWCFECSNDVHHPVSCDIVKKWNQKAVNEGNNAAWIMANTKHCPKCTNPIEKNGGCMHMTCRKPGGCGHEFCWICLQPWQGHTNCNQFKKPENEAVKAARSEIMRYSHYSERFVAHEKAQNATFNVLSEKVNTIAACFAADKNFTLKDFEFLVEAVQQIGKCRRFLKWTYAFAYFQDMTASKQQLFEFHQAQMEGTTERLSDIVENTPWDAFADPDQVSNRPFYDLRQQTISLTDVVREFFDSLRVWISEEVADDEVSASTAAPKKSAIPPKRKTKTRL